MKRLAILLLAGAFMAPGQPMNPYIIEQKGDHQEMHVEWPELNKSIFKPGQPTNPWIIEKNPITGNTEIHTEFPHQPFHRRDCD